MQITLKKSKGVLGKDGKPYAPGTMYFCDGTWLTPVAYSPESLTTGLLNEKVEKVEFIDPDNNQFVITIKR